MRLIDADAAIEAFGLSEKTRKYGGDHSGYDTMMLYEIQGVLDNLPTIEQPQTGKWDSLGGIMDVGDGEEIQCNKCKATYMMVYRDGDYNFCPNCGARMEKK